MDIRTFRSTDEAHRKLTAENVSELTPFVVPGKAGTTTAVFVPVCFEIYTVEERERRFRELVDRFSPLARRLPRSRSVGCLEAAFTPGSGSLSRMFGPPLEDASS